MQIIACDRSTNLSFHKRPDTPRLPPKRSAPRLPLSAAEQDVAEVESNRPKSPEAFSERRPPAVGAMLRNEPFTSRLDQSGLGALLALRLRSNWALARSQSGRAPRGRQAGLGYRRGWCVSRTGSTRGCAR